MGNKTSQMQGFTLIASLLVLVLLSGVAIGLMFLVNSQQHVGSNDSEDTLAYYAAESGMEKMTSDLAALYAASQSPSTNSINNIAAPASYPTAAMVGPGMNYLETISQPPNACVPLINCYKPISSGPEQGLNALVIPWNLQSQVTRIGSGASVNMFRSVEVALIPVFQFGVFCDSDCSYFAGSLFNFAGAVHTNGNLFLASGNNLIINGKVTAFGEIIRDRLANNHPTDSGYTGDVYVPTQTNGCAAGPGAQCLSLGQDDAPNDASWNGGIPPAGSPNAAGDATPYQTWVNDANTFKGFITNHINGAKKLSLPFVQGNNPALAGGAQQIQIIRKALPTDSTSLTNSKLYNKASIRILLADTQALLHPDRPGLNDGQDIDLTNGGAIDGYAVAVNGLGTTRVAMAHVNKDPNGTTYWTAQPTGTSKYGNGNWNLVNGWIRVEYQDSTGNWSGNGITTEWLQLGFARGMNVPTNPENGSPAGRNTAHKNAILILQELNKVGANAPVVDGGTTSEYSWYPINFWDPREGLPRDVAGASQVPSLGGSECFVNGVMNAVELDVGNLNLWLQGVLPGHGISVNSTAENGYVLYFSDRRGMQIDPNDPNGPSVNGEYGFEDVVNAASITGTPDGVLEPSTPGYNVDSNNGLPYSPEDVDENNLKDNWGAWNVGNGFQYPVGSTTPVNTNTNPPNPYKKVDCLLGGRQNIVTGARHVLKLVDGSLGNVPQAPTNPPSGGFTVASENPVYIQGDYNSSSPPADPFWGGSAAVIPHAAAGIIADSVSLLSNNWTDLNSLGNPLNLGARTPTNTYYRVAIAAGKSMNFPEPAWTNANQKDFGTDGGVHNFLRLLENWSAANLYYRGSLVSLYYSEYATGTFKCCTEVYGVPNRYFSFDTDFLNPQNLPPGTPMLQDVNNLSEREDFRPQ